MEESKKNTSLIIVAIVVLVIGILVGGGLIFKGFLEYQNTSIDVAKDIINTAKDTINETAGSVKGSQTSRGEEEVQNDINELDSKINQKQSECDSIDKSDLTGSVNYGTCLQDLYDLKSQKDKLQIELSNIKSENTATNVETPADKIINESIGGIEKVVNSADKDTSFITMIFGGIVLSISVIVFGIIIVIVMKNKKVI